MAYLHRRGPRRINMAAMEPKDPDTVCECTRCRQDVYEGECTVDDGMGAALCTDCFVELVNKRMSENLALFAEELGYEVVWHE